MTKAMLKNDLLDSDKISTNLKTKRIGKQILVYESTLSTNDIAAKYAKNRKNDGLAVFAEQQTAGKGRTGARWLSGRAESILCSIVLTTSKCSAELLSLTAAVAVAETIGKVAGNLAKIKWPNDIIINGKKVAGILLESKRIDHRNIYILGIGINCHQTQDSFPLQLQPMATSIDIESGTVCDRASLARRLLASIEHWLQIAEKNNEIVTDKWRELSILLGCRVSLVFNHKEFTGNCVGLDPEKGLILQLETGGVRMFDAAHTRIVK